MVNSPKENLSVFLIRVCQPSRFLESLPSVRMFPQAGSFEVKDTFSFRVGKNDGVKSFNLCLLISSS
jgi:hypothetical protein